MSLCPSGIKETGVPATLMLMTTYDCNLNCSFCLVEKKRCEMRLETAKKAVDLFMQSCSNGNLIRFFGGEPLLRFGFIKKIVSYVKSRYPDAGTKFDVTTNGTIINKRIVDYFNKSHEIQVIVSLDEEKKKNAVNMKSFLQIKRVLCNLTIGPKYSSNVYENFQKAYKLGFRKFNFLPAFFVWWSNEEINNLKGELEKILRLLKKRKVFIKNVYTLGETPLFVNALVVDFNGDMYTNNIVFTRYASGLKSKMFAGNVKDDTGITLHKENASRVIWKNIEPEIINSTRKVDNVLTCFVHEIQRMYASYEP